MSIRFRKNVGSWYQRSEGVRSDTVTKNGLAMTLINVAFHYRIQPTESQISAINRLRDVYGVRRLTLDEKERTLRIDYDASRLSECEVAGLLRNAGIDVLGKLALT